MNPELKQILDTLTKFGDKAEAKLWINRNKDVIIPLLADIYEKDRNEYAVIIEDILECFPHGTVKVIRNDFKSRVLNLLADRLRKKLEDHWIDPTDPPNLTPDNKGRLVPTQRLLVDILSKSKYLRIIFDDHRKSNVFESYGPYQLPWVPSKDNMLTLTYQVNHKEKDVKEVTYYNIDLKHQKSALKYYLANFFEQELDWKMLQDAINVVANNNRVNTVQDYFNNGIETWDMVDRMDLLARHAGAQNEKWARIVLKSIMLGIMARTFQPGYNYRGTAVLIGEEQTGKSWFVEQLSIHRQFYLQFTFTKNTSDAEIGRLMETRMIVELPDTGGIGTRNDNQIKAFLTQTYDNFRRMRSDVVEDVARSCIFIVTSNSMEYYLGHVGNTRFLPIELGKFDFDAITKELPQLFAQAKYMWDHGETPRLNDDELAMQQEMMLAQEVKPNMFYSLLDRLEDVNNNGCFVVNERGYCRGITISDILTWFKGELWYSTNKEGEYRKQIITILKKYFFIEATYKAVPILDRQLMEKPETSYTYRYVGSGDFRSFVMSLRQQET